MPTLGRRAAAALAGPLLLLVAPVVVLNGFSIQDKLNTSDTLDFFFPTYCFLGKELLRGHLPLWNPYLFGGIPFAADPQSGWMYLPAMALFAALPCDVAIRWLVVLNPVVAGLGLYAFLRSEGLARPLATAGGISLSVAISGSNLAVSLPFAATLAWTAAGLAAASRFSRSRTPAARVGWAAAVAVVWGQLAAAHLSAGLLMGTATIAAYLLARAWVDRREAGIPLRVGVARLAGLAALAPLLNLAYLWPRLAYLPRTTIALGYGGLHALGARAAGGPVTPLKVGMVAPPEWPLHFATFPGVHPGALLLVLAPVAWWSRRHRPVAVAFAALAAVLYLLSLEPVAARIPSGLRSWRLVDLYLHNPAWWSYEIPLLLAVVGTIGAAGWLEAGRRARLGLVLPGAALWGAVPLAMGAPPWRLSVLFAGGLAAAVALVAAVRNRRLLPLVAAAVALEVLAAGLLGGRTRRFEPPLLFESLADPTLAPAEYVVRRDIARGLEATGGRYAKVGLLALEELRKEVEPGVVPNHALFFRVQNLGGYNPVQLVRTWVLVRAAQRDAFRYNVAIYRDPAPRVLLDLLGARAVVAAGALPPEPRARAVASQGGYTVFERRSAPPMASVVTSVRTVAAPDRPFPHPALAAVLDPAFDPARDAVVEAPPGSRPDRPRRRPGGRREPEFRRAGRARLHFVGTDRMLVDVLARSAALVVIRVPHDPGWRARVDGRPVEVLRANYALQAVRVPAGRHRLELVYEDPRVAQGLVGSAAAVLAVAVVALVTGRRGARARPVR